MTRKEDIKKPSRGENIVFLQGEKITRIVIILFALNINIFSQIDLNNFGISEFARTHSGYTKFTFLDYNKDGIKDLFLYGNQEKSFVIHKGLKDSTFSPPTRKFFFFPIDDIKWLTKSSNGDDYYIFVSRNRRLAGLVSFTRTFSLQLLNTIEFNSYPSSLEVTDLDNDGTNEALVYGTNFNGIVLIKNDGYHLESEILNEKNIFSDLLLFDFTQDEQKDLVGLDVLNNAISFFENSEMSGFLNIREVEYDETLISFNISDLNGDNFSDIIVTKEGGIDAFLGDSVYSYSNVENYNTPFIPEHFIIADLNNNSLNDYLMINKIGNQLIYSPDTILNEKSLKFEFDGISYMKLTNDESRLCLLSKNGKLKFLKNNNNWQKSFSYSLGGKPESIGEIRLNDSIYAKLIISNLLENSVSFLEIDSLGTFSRYYDYQILNPFSNFDYSAENELLVTYSYQNRLLEIIHSGSSSITNNPSFLYTSYPIEGLIVKNKNTLETIEVANGELFHEIFTIDDNEFKMKEIFSIDTLVEKAIITNNSHIYYWSRNNSNMKFNKAVNGNINMLLELENYDSLNTAPILIPDKFNHDNQLVTIMNHNGVNKIYIMEDEYFEVFQIGKQIVDLFEDGSANYQYYSSTFNNKTIFVYRKDSQQMFRLEFNKKNKSVDLTNTIEGINLNDYFVSQYFDKTFIVYSNTINNCITYRVID